MRTVSTSKVSSSLMLKHRSSSRWGLLHRPRSSWHQSHSPGRLPSSDDDISYVHNSKIKLVQLNICTTKTKLDHYYSSRVDYRSVESFLENSQLTWCIYSTLGDGRSSLCPRVHYPKKFSTWEWRSSGPHDNSRDSSSSHIYIWWNSPSLIRLWHLWPSVMVAPPFVLECITANCLEHGNEGEATPRQQSGFFVLSYMVETRQT